MSRRAPTGFSIASSTFSEIPLSTHEGAYSSHSHRHTASSSHKKDRRSSISSASFTSRPLTPHSVTNSTSYQNGDTTTDSQLNDRYTTISRATSRPTTRNRPRTGTSTIGGGESQQIICAVSEARGVSPTVGISFVNISTGEAVVSQICDNQFYARTLHKLQVFEPSEILISSSCVPPNLVTNMYSLIEENIRGAKIIPLDRGYWNETTGHDYISKLAFSEDVEAIKVAIGGNYFAVCCLAAAIKYINLSLSLTFAFHSLRIKYQPSEDSMMIDLSTIQSLELIQNIQNIKSRDCLFGLLNETLTPMGSRLLRSYILQPSTQKQILINRYDALDEFQTKEEMFLVTRQALKSFLDVEKLLTNLILIPTIPDIGFVEQRINNILVLKSFVHAIGPVFEALSNAESHLLADVIRKQCQPEKILPVMRMISRVINDDVTYQKHPLDLRNQRTYAVKSGLNGLLDVARVTYKEATADAHQHISDINRKLEIPMETRYDNARRYFLRIREVDLDGREIPNVLINCYRKKGYIECQTLDLVKLNQRIQDSHQEVVLMSDKSVEDLLEEIRDEIPTLFKICECIAMLDMLSGFAQVVTTQDYCRPEITDSLVISSARHPVREKAHRDKYIPNDVYATQQTRFQVITGCNMSGKSTYIRSIALMVVMAQIGCFVPAQYASFPLIHQLFARVSMGDGIEANISTFAAEMRETAFILRNVDSKSLAIIDELGRGTSTRDGLAIALSIAEALVSSKALVWFATHFRELAQVMQERSGVVNFHLAVDMSNRDRMNMLYKLTAGFAKEEHYGLALARAVDLPSRVLEVAEKISQSLEAQAAAKKRSSKTSAISKRRKLVLALHETLRQARDGPMEGKILLSWLRRIQEEFVIRMEKIESDAVVGGKKEPVLKDESEESDDKSDLASET